MTDSNTDTAEHATYAGFWIRFWAAVVDSIVYLLLTAPALIAFYGLKYYDFDDDTYGLLAGPADLLISWIAPIAMTIWMWMRYRATPGKMLFSLKVVKADTGVALTLRESVIRYFAYVISLMPLCIGFIWIAFDRKKQGWHDKLAGSVVVRSKQRGTQAVRLPLA